MNFEQGNGFPCLHLIIWKSEMRGEGVDDGVRHCTLYVLAQKKEHTKE